MVNMSLILLFGLFLLTTSGMGADAFLFQQQPQQHHHHRHNPYYRGVMPFHFAESSSPSLSTLPILDFKTNNNKYYSCSYCTTTSTVTSSSSSSSSTSLSLQGGSHDENESTNNKDKEEEEEEDEEEHDDEESNTRLFASTNPMVWVYQHQPQRGGMSEQLQPGRTAQDDEHHTVNPWIPLSMGKSSSSSLSSSVSATSAAQHTWNWCKDFVVQLDLCPWAKASVETRDAIQIYIVPPIPPSSSSSSSSSLPTETGTIQSVREQKQRRRTKAMDDTILRQQQRSNILVDVAKRFDERLCQRDGNDDTRHGRLPSSTTATISTMEKAAIYLVIFLPNKQLVDVNTEDENDSDTNRPGDLLLFDDFYTWFESVEDEWDIDNVIIAPFHPQWEFAPPEYGDGDDNNDDDDDDETTGSTMAPNPQIDWTAVQYEKRSPYPTVSLVSARVVDQAGEVVTAKIGRHNQDVLSSYGRRKSTIQQQEDVTTTLSTSSSSSTLKRFWHTSIFGSDDNDCTNDSVP
jgi:hypothetical protein